jgi:hypothetical protein
LSSLENYLCTKVAGNLQSRPPKPKKKTKESFVAQVDDLMNDDDGFRVLGFREYYHQHEGRWQSLQQIQAFSGGNKKQKIHQAKAFCSVLTLKLYHKTLYLNVLQFSILQSLCMY